MAHARLALTGKLTGIRAIRGRCHIASFGVRLRAFLGVIMTPGNLTRNSGRLLWNLWRAPSRACRALARWLDAAYKLQRRADRQVPRWFSPQAQAALATIPGYSSA